MTDWPVVLLSGVVGGVFGTTVTGLFTWRATWTSYTDAANKLALDLDNLFIRHSEYRQYFYDSIPLSAEGVSDYSRILAVREFVADSLEGICDNRNIYSRVDWQSWLRYVEELLESSPALRQLLDENEEWYPSLHSALMHEPRPRFARLRRFWRDL